MNQRAPERSRGKLSGGAIASLGGIGFTVSLLMNQLAWRSHTELVNEGTLAVIVASVVAAIIGTIVTSIRARRYS